MIAAVAHRTGCSVSPGFLEKYISRIQTRAGFKAEDSRWTHAAVFLYEDFTYATRAAAAR
jgi:hypothetical protein